MRWEFPTEYSCLDIIWGKKKRGEVLQKFQLRNNLKYKKREGSFEFWYKNHLFLEEFYYFREIHIEYS